MNNARYIYIYIYIYVEEEALLETSVIVIVNGTILHMMKNL